MGRHYYLNFVQPELVYLLHIYYKNKKISKIYSTHITYTSTFVTLLLLAGTKKVITYFLSIYYDLLCVAREGVEPLVRQPADMNPTL